MKISELSHETGAPLATIKFYLREGLLHVGEHSAPNQATYGEVHVRRIHMIRALTDVGGLSVAEAKRVIDAIDSDVPLTRAFEVAQSAVAEADLDLVESRSGLAAKAETVVVGTVLGDALFAALRRSAQAASTVRRYGDPGRK